MEQRYGHTRGSCECDQLGSLRGRSTGRARPAYPPEDPRPHRRTPMSRPARQNGTCTAASTGRATAGRRRATGHCDGYDAAADRWLITTRMLGLRTGEQTPRFSSPQDRRGGQKGAGLQKGRATGDRRSEEGVTEHSREEAGEAGGTVGNLPRRTGGGRRGRRERGGGARERGWKRRGVGGRKGEGGGGEGGRGGGGGEAERGGREGGGGEGGGGRGGGGGGGEGRTRGSRWRRSDALGGRQLRLSRGWPHADPPSGALGRGGGGAATTRLRREKHPSGTSTSGCRSGLGRGGRGVARPRGQRLEFSNGLRGRGGEGGGGGRGGGGGGGGGGGARNRPESVYQR